MATETPNPPATPKFDWEIDAGVIEDARRRQRRQRGIGTALLAAAALVGLALGLVWGSGGGGLGGTARGHGHGANPGAPAHATYDAPVGTVSRAPEDIGQLGLLSPGVGWVANGIGFFTTHDGGHRWSTVKVPGLSGDVVGNLLGGTSPSSNALLLDIVDGGSIVGTCSDPGPPSGALRPLGRVAVSLDAGRSWRTFPFPGCRIPVGLSFISASTGFALTEAGKPHQPNVLFKTTDGASSWRRVAPLPVHGGIDFSSASDGWAWGNNSHGLYRSTDGGRIWRRAGICVRGSVGCGAPHFFGSDGVINAWRITGTKDRVHPLVYTTTNDGRSWVPLDVPVSATGSRHGLPIFAAPDANDLFVMYGGVLNKSTDGGRSWTTIPEPVLDAAGSAGNLQFANADYGWYDSGSRLYYTTDGGVNWKPVGSR